MAGKTAARLTDQPVNVDLNVNEQSHSGDEEDGYCYEKISELIRAISNRTLEMKTNNLRLLNTIGADVSSLLIKADQINKTCLKNRKG